MSRPVTPNYGIAKYGPQGTADPMGVYTVYNPAMDTIDTILASLKALIDALEARMDQAEQDIVDLSNRVTQEVNQINQTISSLDSTTATTLTDIVNKFYGGGTIGEDGHVTWGDAGKAATGNMNLFGNSSLSSYIRTVAGTGTNSVRVN